MCSRPSTLRTSSASLRKSTLRLSQSYDVTRILLPTSLLSANVVLSVVPKRSKTFSVLPRDFILVPLPFVLNLSGVVVNTVPAAPIT